MFSIFMKKPKVIVDCLVTENSVYQLAPIKRAVHYFPDWWKKLPNYGIGDADNNRLNKKSDFKVNMKKCYGFTELYKRSFILPHWCDIHVTVEDNKYRYYSSGGEKPTEHHSDQYGGAFPNFMHMKLMSPWLTMEKTGKIHFAFIGATYSMDQYNFMIAPGVKECRYSIESHVQVLMPMGHYSFYIPIGQPLLQIIPLTEKKVEFRNHLVTLQEWEKYKPRTPSYMSHNQVMRINRDAQSTCPFHDKGN